MSKKVLTPAFGLFPKSTDVIKRNLLTYFVLLVVPLLLTSLTGPQTELAADASFSEGIDAMLKSISPFVVMGSLLALIFFPALLYTELHTAAGKQVALSEAFRGYRYFWRLVGLALLTVIVIILGLLLFIIPGLIMIRRYVLAPYFLMDKNLSITQAMQAAAKATKPVSQSIYSILLVLVLFAFITAFGPVGLAMGTVLQVLYSVAFALRYHEVK